MNRDDVIEGTAIAIREEPVAPIAQAGIFGTNDPVEVIEKATRVADALKRVIVAKKLVANIQGKEYLTVEAWTTLGSMLGLFPFTEWSRPIENGWEARVVVRTRDGNEIAAAEAMCTRDERAWKSRDDYALRSMAMTRAVSKAMRLPLGFIAVLSGFEATPASEVPDGGFDNRTAPKAPPTPRATDTPADRERGRVAVMALASKNGVSDAARHLIAEALFGEPSTKKLATPQLRALYAEINAFIAAKVADDPIEIEGWLVYRQTERELASQGGAT